MSKPAMFASERSTGEILLEALECKLHEALQRVADAQEDVVIWRSMLTSLLRAKPGSAFHCLDPWIGLEVPPRSAMH
jgi:hypothetical protein